MCEQTQRRRVELAENALGIATAALYASGRTPPSEPERTALRRASYRVRADYLQAKCRLRQVMRGA